MITVFTDQLLRTWNISSFTAVGTPRNLAFSWKTSAEATSSTQQSVMLMGLDEELEKLKLDTMSSDSMYEIYVGSGQYLPA